MSRPAQLCLAIASRRSDVEELQATVVAFLRRLGLDDDACWRVDVAAREAVANAIVHGNREDPDKQVRIEVELDGVQLVLRVHDEGAGFDATRLADPRAADRRLVPGGRGVLLMRHFTDELSQEPRAGGGTTVTMRVRLPSRDDLSHSTNN